MCAPIARPAAAGSPAACRSDNMRCHAGSRSAAGVSGATSCRVAAAWPSTSTPPSTWRSWAWSRTHPADIRALASDLRVPGRDALREVAADPHRELLVMGRTKLRTPALARAAYPMPGPSLVEERGLKASPLGGEHATAAFRCWAGCWPSAARVPSPTSWPSWRMAPSSTRGCCWPTGSAPMTAAWPRPRTGSRRTWACPSQVRDPWLAALTRSAAGAPVPILLGAHTLVGPGIRLLLGTDRPDAARGARKDAAAALEWRRGEWSAGVHCTPMSPGYD